MSAPPAPAALEAPRWRVGRLLSPALLLALVCALVALALLQWRHAANRVRLARSVTSIESVLRARVHVTRAYLAAQSLHAGDATFAATDVGAELESARLAVADWLDGRSRVVRVDSRLRRDARLRALVQEYGNGIEAFRELLADSLASADQVAVHMAFADLDARAEAAYRRATEVLDELSAQGERVHAITVFLLVFFILASGVVLHHVIRARERTSAVLTERDTHLRLLLDQLPALTWIADRQLRLVSAGGATLRLVGMRADELVGISIAEVVENDGMGQVLEEHRRALAGQVGRFTLELHGRHIEALLEPLTNDEHEVLGVVGVAVDVTQRHRLEERLRQAHKMEAIGRLAGGVAHDFSNLLNVILVNAEFLRDAMSPEDARRSDVDEILGACERGSRLVRQLLAVSRQHPQVRTELDLAELVRVMAPMLRRIAGNGRRLQIHTTQGRNTVRADQSQMEQVILNLVTNARDATREGDEIEVRVESATAPGVALPHESPGAPTVRLVVSDSGHGMDEVVRTRIFEPFFTTKELGRGTGLGLATVYGIVEQSGGTIHVESAPGQGTTFVVALPAA